MSASETCLAQLRRQPERGTRRRIERLRRVLEAQRRRDCGEAVGSSRGEEGGCLAKRSHPGSVRTTRDPPVTAFARTTAIERSAGAIYAAWYSRPFQRTCRPRRMARTEM